MVLLAANLPDRLDKALVRGLTCRMTFAFPEASRRATIWRNLLPDTGPTDGHIDLAFLGEAFPLTGGHIKNAVFKAAFRAASANSSVTQNLLEGAAREELDFLQGVSENRRAIGSGK